MDQQSLPYIIAGAAIILFFVWLWILHTVIKWAVRDGIGGQLQAINDNLGILIKQNADRK